VILSLILTPLAFLAGCTKSDSKATDGKTADKAGDSSTSKFENGRAALEAMAAAYRGAKTYQDNAIVRLTAQCGAKSVDEKHDFSVAFERPNKIHLDIYGVRIRCDGLNYHAFINDLPGQVVEKDAPPKLDIKNLYGDPVLARTISLGGPAAAPPQPLLLLEDKALDFLLAGAEKPVLLPDPGEIEGHKCVRVQIPRPEGDATFWIDAETSVLRRIVLSTEALRPSLAQKLGGEVESSSLTVDFTGAALDQKVRAAAFQFEMPRGEDVTTEKYFVPAHPGQLIGKKTPNFKFTDDEGRAITPESLVGKIVVMLFWSPQQGDYSQSLIDLQKIYDGYKNDKSVAVFAVCLDGDSLDRKAMAELRQSLNLSVPIYRDLEKSTPDFRYFDVVFILGPYGTVQDYELVADANLLTTMQRKIEGAIAGQSLVEDATSRAAAENRPPQRTQNLQTQIALEIRRTEGSGQYSSPCRSRPQTPHITIGRLRAKSDRRNRPRRQSRKRPQAQSDGR
jgi:peroxiredoxin